MKLEFVIMTVIKGRSFFSSFAFEHLQTLDKFPEALLCMPFDQIWPEGSSYKNNKNFCLRSSYQIKTP